MEDLKMVNLKEVEPGIATMEEGMITILKLMISIEGLIEMIVEVKETLQSEETSTTETEATKLREAILIVEMIGRETILMVEKMKIDQISGEAMIKILEEITGFSKNKTEKMCQESSKKRIFRMIS
jgi:hypothetical protein